MRRRISPAPANESNPLGEHITVERAASGPSQTAYDLLRIGAWALVIFESVLVVVGLIGYWSAQRGGA